MLYLPSPIPLHDLATIICHSIVDSLAFVFNMLLLVAILLKTPAGLRSYKVLLFNSAIVDILSSFTMFMHMIRLIPVHHTLAYVYDGPCVYISGKFCHTLFTVTLATCNQSMFIIALSFCYRLYVLGRPNPSTKAVTCVALIASIPNLIVMTTFVSILDDAEDVRVRLQELRPEYALDAYVVEGILSIANANAMFTILADTMPICPTLILIFIVRRKVLKKLTAHSIQMSGRTAKMHKTLTRSMLPVCFSGAVGSYVLCQLDISCSPVQEHFIFESLSLMTLFSPMITLYSTLQSFHQEPLHLQNEPSTTKAAGHHEQISVI